MVCRNAEMKTTRFIGVEPFEMSNFNKWIFFNLDFSWESDQYIIDSEISSKEKHA